MAKKIELILVSVFFVLISHLTNAYYVEVINNTDTMYSKVDIVLFPLNFNATYGHFHIDLIGSREAVSENVGNVFLNIPLSGTGLPSYDPEIEVVIVASPQPAGMSEQHMKTNRTLRLPTKVIVASPWPNREKLEGWLMPDVTITISGSTNEDLVVELDQIY